MSISMQTVTLRLVSACVILGSMMLQAEVMGQEALLENASVTKRAGEDWGGSFRIKAATPQQQEDEVIDPKPEMVRDSLPNVEETLWNEENLTKPIMDIPISIIDHAERQPVDASETDLQMDYRSNYALPFQHRAAMWCAPNIQYNPLYFEDVGLERYGYDCGDLVQPGISGLHFGISTVFLPINVFRQPPWSCTYPFGFCRPGSFAPQTKNVWFFWK